MTGGRSGGERVIYSLREVDDRHDGLIGDDMEEFSEKEASTKTDGSSYCKRRTKEPHFNVSTSCVSGPT